MQETQVFKRNVVLVLGVQYDAYGFGAWLDDLKLGLEKHGAKVVIPPLEKELTLPLIAKTLKTIDPHLPTTIFLYAHGNVSGDGLHEMELQPDKMTRTLDIFALARKAAHGKPIDMFVASCQSGLARSYANALPKGSTVVTLADPKGNTYTDEIERLADTLLFKVDKNQSLSAIDLLKAFLMGQLRDGSVPAYAVSHGPAADLVERLHAHEKGGFLPGDFGRAAKELSGYMTGKDVRATGAAITTAPNTPNVSYGRKLALCLAALRAR
jgi:hypothetical protein